MPDERTFDEARRVMAKSRVEGARRNVQMTGEALSLGDIVEIVLGDGDWSSIEGWTEFALIDQPLISTEELVDGIVSVWEWTKSNS